MRIEESRFIDDLLNLVSNGIVSFVFISPSQFGFTIEFGENSETIPYS